MIPAVGLAIGVDNLSGLIIAVLVVGYLVYALVTPEKL